MEELNQKHVEERITCGNRLADAIASYLNRKYGWNLVANSLQEDKQGFDFTAKTNVQIRTNWNAKTFQFKIRDKNRGDLLSEYCRFKHSYVEGGRKYRIEPGREFIHVTNAVVWFTNEIGEPQKIHIADSKDVDKIIAEAITYWFKQKLIDPQELEQLGIDPEDLLGTDESLDSMFSDQFIRTWWKKAEFEDNKRRHVFTHNSVAFYFKIDEGEDHIKYSKIISFITPAIIKEKGFKIQTISIPENENIFE